MLTLFRCTEKPSSELVVALVLFIAHTQKEPRREDEGKRELA